MDNITLNTYLSRILSGYYLFVYKNNRYKLIYPDITIKYEADVYANEEYINNRFNDWINQDDILHILMMMGIWNPSMEQELKGINSKIDDLKVEYYKSFLNKTKLKTLKRQLSSLKKRYDFLYNLRHSLDHLTSEGYSSLLKNQYILVYSLYDNKDQNLFSSIDDVNFSLFNALSNIIHENLIPSEAFREIARSDIWRNYWSANKERIFDKPTINWSDEQKTLVILTKMYDNAYEHPDCPSDSIIEDDDAFDGWMIMQRKQNEKDKNKKRTESLLGDKLNKAGEVFLVANSMEEAQEIYNLNDDSSRHTINERQKTILSSENPIDTTQLPDVQRELLSQQFQSQKERFKK